MHARSAIPWRKQTEGHDKEPEQCHHTACPRQPPWAELESLFAFEFSPEPKSPPSLLEKVDNTNNTEHGADFYKKPEGDTG